jgi:hypothetical protein
MRDYRGYLRFCKGIFIERLRTNKRERERERENTREISSPRISHFTIESLIYSLYFSDTQYSSL